MSKLTLDASLPEKLRAAKESVEICDESGQLLGRYFPNRVLQEKIVALLRKKVTPEKLDRRAAETGQGCTWEELREKLISERPIECSET